MQFVTFAHGLLETNLVLGDDVRGEDAVHVDELVHDEVDEGDVVAGEPRPVAQEARERLQPGGQRGHVVGHQVLLRGEVQQLHRHTLAG